jgi:phosphotriesterase-related protein
MVEPQAGRGEKAAPRAGILKVAAGPEGLRESKAIGRLFLAAAGAAAQTRAPVLIHTEEGRQGEALAAFFLEHGVAASQLIFSHLDKKPDNAREMLSVLSMGAWVCLDTILRPHAVSDDAEIALIHTLLEAGYRDRLLMGLDVTRARMRSYGGSVGLADLRRVFLPLLRGQGIGDETIVAMTVANPARALAWVPCGEAAAVT